MNNNINMYTCDEVQEQSRTHRNTETNQLIFAKRTQMNCSFFFSFFSFLFILLSKKISRMYDMREW